MRKMLVLAGVAASGKDSVRNYLINNGFTSAISVTDREKRINEINGVHYHFKTKEEFSQMSLNNCFGNEVEFAGRRYALSYEELSKEGLICGILESTGIQQLRNNGIDLFVVLLIPESVELMKERILLRENNKNELEHRTALAQHELFQLFPLANTIVVNYRDSKIEELAEYIKQEYLNWLD